MIIDLREIEKRAVDIVFQPKVSDFPSLVEIMQSGDCKFTDPLRVEMKIGLAGELVLAAGRFRLQANIACNRCLQRYDLTLESDFELTFIQQTACDDLRSPDQEVIELSEAEMDLLPFSGDQIDFTEAVQSEIVAAMPMRPLCSDHCKGLCHTCGADLNQGPCNCRPESINPSFAILKDLKLDKR
jgi:uncharacterized protein